jgi:hypothetical protein
LVGHPGPPLLIRTWPSNSGKAELVVQDAAAYQTLRRLADEARVLEGIRQGIEDMNAGRTVCIDRFKEHARTKHGINT